MMTNYDRETIKLREAAPIAGIAFLAESQFFFFTEVGKICLQAKTLSIDREYIIINKLKTNKTN